MSKTLGREQQKAEQGSGNKKKWLIRLSLIQLNLQIVKQFNNNGHQCKRL